MADPKYKVTFYMEKEDGEIVPFEELTPEELKRFQEKGAERLSSWGNRYFGQHTEIYETL